MMEILRNMKKKVWLFFLVVCLMGSSIGCGRGKDSGDAEDKNVRNEASDKEGQRKDSGEIKEITWMYAQMSGMIPEDLQKVQEAVNKITEEKIGVRVKLNPISFADYTNQISLVMASQEKVDIITTAGTNIWASLLNQNQLTSLNELLEQYGSDIKEILPETFIDGTTVDGNIYALVNNSAGVGTWGIQMRKDLIEKYGLEEEVEKLQMVDDIMDMDENIAVLEHIFQTIKENEPELEIFYPWGAHLAVSYDGLSDKLGVMLKHGTEIENLYATENFEKLCSTMYGWTQDGYIMKDAAVTTESVGSLMQSGRLFAFGINTGRNNFVGEENGYEVYSVNLKLPTIDNGITIFANCIPVTSTEPEAAMKFLNLLYGSEELVNLLAYGIEGEHYVKTEDGKIAYPEGVDPSTSKYPGDQSYMYGNALLTYFHETHTVQSHDEEIAFRDIAEPMSCLGFNYNPQNVKNEAAACTSVLNEYVNGLTLGALDPSVELPNFLEKLEKSGIDRVIAEKQEQYENWKKGKEAE